MTSTTTPEPISVPVPISVTVTPTSGSALLGNTLALADVVGNTTNTAVKWSVAGIAGGNNSVGTISAGIFTAPQTLPTPASVTVTATSVADPTKSGAATITIASDIGIAILPQNSAVELGSQQSFQATIASAGRPSTAVIWTLNGTGCTANGCGSISSAGVFTAPQVPPSTPTVLLTATSVADPSKAQTAQITITALPVTALAVAPIAATVTLGATANFNGTVTGNSDPSVTWDVNGVIGGNATIGTVMASPSNSGAATYTAPQTMPGTSPVSVRARSNASPNVTATAQVMLRAPIQVSLAPATASLIAGQRQTFAAQVLNATSTNVVWQVNGTSVGNSGGSSVLGQVCVVNSDPCQAVTSTAAGSVDYIAPTAVPSTNPVTLTVISQADATQASSSTITILPHVVVSVLPPSATLAPGASQLFSTSLSGSANQQVTWTVSGTACSGANAPCGTISATGLYQAPAAAPSPNSFSVVATSSADTARMGFAAITIATTPTITSLLPSSATAGAAGGFSLQVEGANFAASSPGPGSTILISGSARNTVCSTALACTTTLASSDLQVAASLSVTVQNPDGSASNSAAFVVVPAIGAPTNIPVTSGAPAPTGQDIVVVDLSTNGAAAPPADVSLNVVVIGIFVPASGSCLLGGGPVALVPPASGTATADLCAFSTGGLDPSLLYTLSGPTPGDISIAGTEPLGLGIVHLTLKVPAAAKTGARSLLIKNANLDVTAGSGAIDVQ